MSILSDTFIALFPLYVYMLVGLTLRKVNLLDDSLNQKINKLVFRLFLPCSLFRSAYGIDFHAGADKGVILFVVIAYLTLFLILMVTVPAIIKDNRPAAASIIQAGYRSNFVILGLTYAQFLYGDENIGAVSILTAVIIPLFNGLAVITFELMRGGRVQPLRILLRILRNPLILAVLLGIILNIAGFKIPTIINKPLYSLADIATPLALIIIGATLTLDGFKRNLKLVLSVTALRLVIVPLILVPITALLGYRDVVLVALMVSFAGPCAVSGVPMAYEMGGDGELSGQLAATTTLLSIFTIFLFIVCLRALGLC